MTTMNEQAGKAASICFALRCISTVPKPGHEPECRSCEFAEGGELYSCDCDRVALEAADWIEAAVGLGGA